MASVVALPAAAMETTVWCVIPTLLRDPAVHGVVHFPRNQKLAILLMLTPFLARDACQCVAAAGCGVGQGMLLADDAR